MAELVNEAIGHPIAFMLALVQTGVWTALVLRGGFDPHGFWYLYTATAVSYVTQFTLTLVGLSAKREAAKADASAREALTALLATMKAVEALIATVRLEERERGEQMDQAISEIHDLLDEQRDL